MKVFKISVIFLFLSQEALACSFPELVTENKMQSDADIILTGQLVSITAMPDGDMRKKLEIRIDKVSKGLWHNDTIKVFYVGPQNIEERFNIETKSLEFGLVSPDTYTKWCETKHFKSLSGRRSSKTSCGGPFRGGLSYGLPLYPYILSYHCAPDIFIREK